MFRGSAKSLLDQRSRRTALRSAAVIGVIGLTVVLGWILGITWPRRWLNVFPDTRLLTGIALIILAKSFWMLARKGELRTIWRQLPNLVLLGIGVAAIGLLLLAYFQDPVPASALWMKGPQGMSAYSAICFALTGMGLGALMWERRSRGNVVAGICGTLIGVLATGILLVSASNLVDPQYQSSLITMSLPSTVAFLVAGLSIVKLAWRRDTALLPLPGWAALSLGTATLVTTLIFWFAFVRREEDRTQAVLNAQTQATQRQVNARLDETIMRVCQLGSIAFSDSAAWSAAAQRSFGVSPSLEAVAYTGVRLGSTEIEGLQLRHAALLPTLRELLRTESRPSPEAAVAPVLLDGEDYLLFRVPVCGHETSGAVTLTLWHAQRLLDLALAGAAPAYRATLFGGGRRLYAPDSSALPETIPYSSLLFTHAGLNWRLEVAQGNETRNLSHPALPGLVGGLGILLSLLMTLTVALIRVTATSARYSERERLARGLESTMEGLWEWHPRTGESIRSRGIWERLGYPFTSIPQEEHTQRWVGLVAEDERPRVQTLLRDHLEGRSERYEAEYEVRAYDGSPRWIADRGRVVERDAEGRPTLVVGVSTDVTEQRRAEHARERSERQFRAVFDSGYDAQWVLDDECRVVEANRAALDFVATTLDDVRGRYFWDTPWWTAHPESQRHLRHACDTAKIGTPYTSEEEMTSLAGVFATMAFSVTPIHDGAGQATQYLAEARDITDRKRIQEALLERDALSTMGRVAARVAHEINNALASIQNAFLLIKDAVQPTHPHFGYVAAIEREVTRIAAITRQLYETYRPEKDPGSGAPAGVIIVDAINLLEQINRKAGVRIAVDVSATPGIIRVPAAPLRQAIYNLVQNAMEASPPASTVSVRTWRDQDTFGLSVANSGARLSAELRESIARPFVTTQADMDSARLGLGFSLVRRSVSAMNGRIEIIDPPEGGTEIHVLLPISSQKAS